ncbi:MULTISPECIES: hypothetical protein [unclassified Modestobacter]
MGLFGKMAKAGLAKKAMNEARKPQNQQKLKSAFSSLTNRGNSGGKSSGTRRG